MNIVQFTIGFLAIYLLIALLFLISHITTDLHLKNFKKRTYEGRLFWEAAFRDGSTKLTHAHLRKMKQPGMLVAFRNALEGMPLEQRRGILLDNQKAIRRWVKKQPMMEKAYLSYILASLSFGPTTAEEWYDSELLHLLHSHSVYVRENALKALYNAGHIDSIAAAWDDLSTRDVHHHEKLLADGLLEANCDPKELARALMEGYDGYTLCYRLALIQYLTFSGNHDYDEKLKYQLLSKDESPDIRCSVLRLLAKAPTRENAQLVLHFLDNSTEEDWEPVITAVSTLSSYPLSDEIVRMLCRTLTSPNWNIRKNSAESLCRLGLSDAELDVIETVEDAYAKDALRYARQQKKEVRK